MSGKVKSGGRQDNIVDGSREVDSDAPLGMDEKRERIPDIAQPQPDSKDLEKGTNPDLSSSRSRTPENSGPASEAHVCPKALEAGFSNVKRKGNQIIVDWDGPDDPTNPLNWPMREKWIATLIVSAFTFISPVSSSMIAPASGQLASEFGITNSAVLAMTTSVFVLGYAIGPLVLGPFSEMYGRSRVLQLANMWYLVWNTACGGAQNKGELIAFRFLAGLGGSAPLAIGGGLLSDCWRAEERGRAIALYSLAPLLGPVIGPLCGSWIAERSTWRWVFWSTTIVDGAVQVAGLFLLRETFHPLLLERKAERLRNSVTDEAYSSLEIVTPFSGEHRSVKHIFAKAITRPFALFAREPIIQLLGVYMAFVYGLIYLVLTTIPDIFQDIYHENVGIAGLNYLALGIGLTGFSQLNARLMDPIYKRLKARNNGVGRPEFRLPSMVPATIFLPIGLLIFGWAAEEHVHWVVADLGSIFISAGIILNFQSIQIYVIDAFTLHAASALAAVSVLRSLAGFGFPLFAPAMYNALGYGKGNTVLAAVAIAVGCPAPWLFWKYGETIRHKSRYAAKH